MDEQILNVILEYNIYSREKCIMLLSVSYSVFTYRCVILNTKPQFLGSVKKLLCEMQKPAFRFGFFSRL